MPSFCPNLFRLSKLTNPLRIRFSRCLSQFQYDADPTNDLNEVILLGSVNSVSVREDPRPHVIVSLLTKNTYKTVKGYGVKYLSHRVHIFEPPLVEKARRISKSDRICVCGYLNAFPLTDDPKEWYQCVVARSISPYADVTQSVDMEPAENMDDAQSILKPEDLI